ncbi:WG repeat-containing protein [Micromonospora chersina]
MEPARATQVAETPGRDTATPVSGAPAPGPAAPVSAAPAPSPATPVPDALVPGASAPATPVSGPSASATPVSGPRPAPGPAASVPGSPVDNVRPEPTSAAPASPPHQPAEPDPRIQPATGETTPAPVPTPHAPTPAEVPAQAGTQVAATADVAPAAPAPQTPAPADGPTEAAPRESAPPAVTSREGHAARDTAPTEFPGEPAVAPEQPHPVPAPPVAQDSAAQPTTTERTDTTPTAQDAPPQPTTALETDNTQDAPPERTTAVGTDNTQADQAQPTTAPGTDGTPTREAARPAATEQGAPEPDADAERRESRPADPEQALAAIRWRLHPETLREEAPDPTELREIRDGLTTKLGSALDNRSRARLLSLRSVASRILGDLDDALADARLALTYAEATGELRRTALARARLAEVLRWRGEHAEADRLFAEANSPELPDRLRAVLHEHAGRSCYDQGRLTEACLHFERALDLRQGEDPELNARTSLALDAVAERAATGGFGPKPRSRETVLGGERHPVPTFDEEQELWGYADAEGELVIAHRYAEVQPFREGLAWVRRPEASRWALIDTTGAALIEANNGYRAVGSFSEGLSWVSMDGKGRWMAVDRTNIVKIPPGYEDVRPFRGGLAAVRQNGGWGAVDRTGQVVVPTRYHGLTTALADGRYVDGFTEDGLAVVELAGRRGVVDRTGRVVVAPAYPTVVVHPVAFLVGDESGRWGALDRRGERLIEPVHPSRAAVVAEIDRLLADTTPVL